MIDWHIPTASGTISEQSWYFPSFLLQEYLLALINVGKDEIDPYADTRFDLEDCRRLQGNIHYLLDNGMFDRRDTLWFDSQDKGLVKLSCKSISTCLTHLHTAAGLAIKHRSVLVFLGD